MVSDIKNCIKTTIDAFGGLDIIIGNAGFTKFSNFKDLDAMSYEEWDKCWNTNVKGNHALLKEALPTLNANPDGGVFILTSSVAGKSLSGSSMAYSVTKAAQIHLMKCLAHTQGPKIRVNAVLPGLLLTDWGNLYGDDRINGLKNVAALKKETELGDCAQMFVDIARNTSMTGQAVHVGELARCWREWRCADLFCRFWLGAVRLRLKQSDAEHIRVGPRRSLTSHLAIGKDNHNALTIGTHQDCEKLTSAGRSQTINFTSISIIPKNFSPICFHLRPTLLGLTEQVFHKSDTS